MTALPILSTPRLTLRVRSPEDAEALFPTMSDPAVMTWWSRAPFASLDELRDYFTARADDPWRTWAITRHGDDRAIGFVSATERRPGVSEFGYLLAREAHRQGLAAEAAAGLIDWLLAQGNRRIYADTDPDNRGSIGLLERLGFTLEGRLRGEWHTHIGVRDSLIYGLLAEEWPDRKAGTQSRPTDTA